MSVHTIYIALSCWRIFSQFGDLKIKVWWFSSVNFSRSRMVVSTMTWIMIHKKYESSEKSEKLPGSSNEGWRQAWQGGQWPIFWAQMLFHHLILYIQLFLRHKSWATYIIASLIKEITVICIRGGGDLHTHTVSHRTHHLPFDSCQFYLCWLFCVVPKKLTFVVTGSRWNREQISSSYEWPSPSSGWINFPLPPFLMLTRPKWSCCPSQSGCHNLGLGLPKQSLPWNTYSEMFQTGNAPFRHCMTYSDN